jgi:hypothetical protein
MIVVGVKKPFIIQAQTRLCEIKSHRLLILPLHRKGPYEQTNTKKKIFVHGVFG